MKRTTSEPALSLETNLGKLYQGDCLKMMDSMEKESIDLVFADPPFNLNKSYPSKIDDNLLREEYLLWQDQWLKGCIRVLKPGGSMFVWNLPKWNLIAGNLLNKFLTFRHWIAVDIKYRLPIQGRLYPSHYSLLYYCKGPKPRSFHPDRLPMEVCPHCTGDLKDYGGYKNKMNPLGVNLADVWYDIPPVRHAKYKRRDGANELSIKLMDRIIEMASNEGDIVFDPFGGAGTTYAVAEIKGRRWIGIELGPIDVIVRRLKNLAPDSKLLEKYRNGYNQLFTEETTRLRKKRAQWTLKTLPTRSSRGRRQLSLYD